MKNFLVEAFDSHMALEDRINQLDKIQTAEDTLHYPFKYVLHTLTETIDGYTAVFERRLVRV